MKRGRTSHSLDTTHSSLKIATRYNFGGESERYNLLGGERYNLLGGERYNMPGGERFNLFEK